MGLVALSLFVIDFESIAWNLTAFNINNRLTTNNSTMIINKIDLINTFISYDG